MQSQLRWVSSERMLADGMTKLQSRQTVAEMLKGGHLCLIADENFVAAKKKTNEQCADAQAKSYGSGIAKTLSTILAASLANETASM